MDTVDKRPLGLSDDKIESINGAAPKLFSKIKRHPYSILTTGMVAKFCQVAPRTVSNWCDKKHIESYRIPCSNDRRIYLDDFIEFCKKHGLRIHPLLMPTKVIAFGIHENECPQFAELINDPITYGVLQSEYTIRAAIVGDKHGLDYAVISTQTTLAIHVQSSVVLVVSDDVSDMRLQELPFTAKIWKRIKIIKRPVDPSVILNAVGIDPDNRQVFTA